MAKHTIKAKAADAWVVEAQAGKVSLRVQEHEPGDHPPISLTLELSPAGACILASVLVGEASKATGL